MSIRNLFQRLSKTFKDFEDFQRLSKTIKEFQRLSKTFKDFQRLSKTFKDLQRLTKTYIDKSSASTWTNFWACFFLNPACKTWLSALKGQAYQINQFPFPITWKKALELIKTWLWHTCRNRILLEQRLAMLASSYRSPPKWDLFLSENKDKSIRFINTMNQFLVQITWRKSLELIKTWLWTKACHAG